MRIWYAIRKPIGVIVFTLAFWLLLGVIHAIPNVIANTITGI